MSLLFELNNAPKKVKISSSFLINELMKFSYLNKQLTCAFIKG